MVAEQLVVGQVSLTVHEPFVQLFAAPDVEFVQMAMKVSELGRTYNIQNCECEA